MPRPRLARLGALTGAVAVGALTALQARANGGLGLALEDGFVAAGISFGSGLVLIAVICLVVPAGRRGTVRLLRGMRMRDIPWWMLVGGLAGAFSTAVQGLTVGLIGVSLYTVGYVAGQTVFGLVLDRVGYGPAGVVAVTLPRVAGGALALVAVIVSVSGGAIGAVPLWMLVLPFLVGMAVAWQQATNGRLRARAGTPLVATLVNFAVGTAALAVIAGIHIAVVGAPQPFPSDPWLYLGGLFGVGYILLSAGLVAYTGVLLLGLGAIVGQLLTSLILDAVWPATAGPPAALEFVVIGVALASVAVAVIPWRRRRRS